MTFILLPETNKLNQWKKAVFSKSSSAYHQQGDHLVGSQCPGEPYVYKPCMCVHDQGKMTNWTLVTVSRAWQEINALSHLTPVFSTLFDSWRKVESFFFFFSFFPWQWRQKCLCQPVWLPSLSREVWVTFLWTTSWWRNMDLLLFCLPARVITPAWCR